MGIATKRTDYVASTFSKRHEVAFTTGELKTKQRFEVLLLDNPEGLMTFHAKRFLGCDDAGLEVIANELSLVNYNGFLVHPYYADHVQWGHAFPTRSDIANDETVVDKSFMQKLMKDPDMSIYTALKVTKVKNYQRLIAFLLYFVKVGTAPDLQYTAVKFLNQRFNFKLRVCL